MYTERLAAIWKFYGNVHPSIADTLNNIAAVHDKQGNYVEAILGLCFFVIYLCVCLSLLVYIVASESADQLLDLSIYPLFSSHTHSLQRRTGHDPKSVSGRPPVHRHHPAQHCRRLRATRLVLISVVFDCAFSLSVVAKDIDYGHVNQSIATIFFISRQLRGGIQQVRREFGSHASRVWARAPVHRRYLKKPGQCARNAR